MAPTPDPTTRPSQAEGEPQPGGKPRQDKAPRPSQAEGEAEQAQAAARSADEVGARSRVQHGEPFRAGETAPAPASAGAVSSAPRPSQAEGELNRAGEAEQDKAPRPSQAEGEAEQAQTDKRKPA